MYKIKNKKTVIIVTILVAAGTYFFLRTCNKGIGKVFRYEEASIGDVKKTISVAGTLEILDLHLVPSKISGLVTNVYVDYNSEVKKGQVLATLDTTEIDQELLRIDSKRKAAAYEMLSAKSDLNTKKDMLKDNLISKKALELAELQYKKIDTELEMIQNEYKIAQIKKSYTKILAPSSGVVISKDIEPNIPITENKVLFTIAEDLKKMRLIIQVDESDYGLIKKGKNVMFTVSAYPEKKFEGKITQVRLEPIKKDQLISYEALVTCDNSELLLVWGMTATATVDVDSRKDVLRVPSEAFIVSPVDIAEEDTGKKYVWKKKAFATIDSLPVERIEVKTGLAGDYFTEIITDRIKAGDEILVGINKSGPEVKDAIRQ